METPIVTPEEAVQSVHSGDRVFVHGGAAAPRTLIDALMARAGELSDVEIVHMHSEGPAPYVAPGMERHFHHRALFVSSSTREAVNAGRADYVPVFLSDIPRLFHRGRLPIDVALVNLSHPDPHGYCSLGTSVDIAYAAVACARLVIAQFNKAVPRTLGDSFVPVRRVHRGVEVDEPPIEVSPKEPTDVERRIGAHVAELISDGATIQMGIGGIPNAVLSCLFGKRDLGVHTEMFSDGLVDLVNAGVVTGNQKEINRGKIVASFVIGTSRVYRFVDDNPSIEMHPVDYTNDTAVIRRLRRIVAINSAIEVDLTGQVVADAIGPKIYSGVGGQMDFMRGAALAEFGRPIIALPSTAKNGTVSRIVAALTPGAAVVTTRAHAHFIVTEHGIAFLHGKSLRERVDAMIRIAHPANREELARAAREQLLG